VTEFARESHYIPQFYLRRWSLDGRRVWAYRLLVPRADYLKWRPTFIRGIARQAHLYTSVGRGGEESDRVERWFSREVEAPAIDALERVVRDEPLGREDWHKLAMFAAALDVRTAAAYMEHAARAEATVPDALREVLANLEPELKRRAKKKAATRQPVDTPSADTPAGRFPLRVRIERSADGGRGMVHAEVTVGRQLWLYEIEHLLTNTAKVLQAHSWSILKPHPGWEWFTCDHPVVRLNCYEEGRYDFRGGWGSNGTEIFLPLSPRHMMYAKVGAAWPPEQTLTPELTLSFQQFVAERALRWIYARQPTQKAEFFRPRVVDLQRFKGEDAAWERWHTDQTAAETSEQRIPNSPAIPAKDPEHREHGH
jgi:uncharacterized protein DUF4238